MNCKYLFINLRITYVHTLTVYVNYVALGVEELMKKAGHTKFFHLVEEVGLGKHFPNLDNVTFFIPTDEAFEV